MPKIELLNRSGARIDPGLVEKFATGLAGRVIRPGDDDYEGARRIWNAAIERHPGLIVRCLGAADVVHAVTFARANDVLAAVRGGGHNVAGRALCDDGMVIDLSAMRGVLVDPKARTVQVQGGATLGDLDRETHLHSLAVPVGVVSKTGVAGLTLGGGVGWLVRKHGLSCDNVISFELVTADGRLLTASAEENPDLFWALRGGGGNFGIVTSFRFRAHPVSTVLGGLIAHPRDKAGEVLRHYRDFMATAPEELTAYAGMITTPDGMPATVVIACWCGDLAEGKKSLRPCAPSAPLSSTPSRKCPSRRCRRCSTRPFPTRDTTTGRRASCLNSPTISSISWSSTATGCNRPFLRWSSNSMAARLGKSVRPKSAFAQRRAEFNIGMMAQWLDPAESAKHTAWTREMFDAVEPYSDGSHLLNFQSEAGADVIRAAFGDNYARLAEVKRKYDPTNFFSLNQNIQAAAA